MKTPLVVLLFLLVHSGAAAAPPPGPGTDPQRGFGGQIYGHSTQQAEMNNSALKRTFSFGHPQQTDLENLLAQGKFTTLDFMFKQRMLAYKNDAQYESYVMAGYDQFSPNFKIAEKDLTLWVGSTGSAAAYTAIGVYRAMQKMIAMAWGSKQAYGKPLTKDELARMQELDKQAAQDLQTALDKDPTFTPAYVWLFKIARGSNLKIDVHQLVKKLEENDKRSFAARAEYVTSLGPRWKGSFERMAAYSKEAAQSANLNPRLWSLQGEVFADQAEMLFNSGLYEKAIEKYTEALQFGDRIAWLKKRAECYDRIDKKDWAAADYERVRFYDPHDTAVRYRSARLKLSDLDYTLTDNSFIPARPGTEKIRTVAVLPVDYHDDSLHKSAEEVRSVARRNSDKIELMLLRLGYDCVERAKLEALLTEQRLSLTGLTEEKVKLVGKLINADAVVMTSIPSQGVDINQGAAIENIDIKAVSVATGKILWKSLLKGSVVGDRNTYATQNLYDEMETRLYGLLEAKLKKALAN